MPEHHDTVANKQLVADFLRVFSTGDIDAIGALMHEHLQWWVSGTVPGISGTYGKAQMLSLLAQVTQIYKQGALTITPSNLLAEGKQVAAEAESYAELHDGRVYNNLYNFVFEIEDGLIKGIKEYMDTQHVRDIFLVEP